jgi:ABC-type multidrug transport system ATPase subunit
LLGPNGAGKSTALLAIAGGLRPSAGTIAIAGVDLAADPLAAKRQVGLADQPPSLYEYFTVAEHLAMIATVRGGHDAAAERALLDELGLGAVAERPCRELSFGMRQRVGLAAALVGRAGGGAARRDPERPRSPRCPAGPRGAGRGRRRAAPRS